MSTVEKSASEGRSRRPADRPEELISAALAVFAERGFRGATLAEVARRAGVSKGTVYLYFHSKDDLFRAVVAHRVVVLIEAGEALLERHDGSTAALLRRVVSRLMEALEREDMLRLSRLVAAEAKLFPEIREFWWQHVILRNRRLLASIVERGIADGELKPEALQVIPRAIPSVVFFTLQSRALYGDLDVAAPSARSLIEATLTALLDGLTVGGSK